MTRISFFCPGRCQAGGRVPVDELYERALQVTLQVLVN